MSKNFTKVRCTFCKHSFYVESAGATAYRFECPNCHKGLSVGYAKPPVAPMTPPPSLPLPPAPSLPPASLLPPNNQFGSPPKYSNGRGTRDRIARRRRSIERTKEPMPTWLKFFLIYLIGQICLAPFIVIVVILAFFAHLIGADDAAILEEPKDIPEYKTDFEALRNPPILEDLRENTPPVDQIPRQRSPSRNRPLFD